MMKSTRIELILIIKSLEFNNISDLQMLGFRMYDNETGRFTTPDLLWSAFPAQTPYHYAYNSPMIWSDPSGLAPEKEKEGERLMGLFDWREIEEGLGSVSRFIASLQNSIYDTGGVSNYAKEPKGGSRKGGSTSSANNGQGGQSTDDNSSGGGFWSSVWKTITGIFSSDDESESDGEGCSGWVWNGVDYGSRDALVAATSRNNGEGPANDGLRRYTTPEVVVDGKKVDSNTNDNFGFVQDVNNGLEYLEYIDGGILLTNTYLLSTGGSTKVTNVLNKVNGVGGKIGKIALPVNVIANLSKYNNDEISASRLSYNLSTTGISWGIGYYFGGIYGLGAGVFFTYLSTLYDGLNSYTYQMGIKMSEFNQGMINGVLRK